MNVLVSICEMYYTLLSNHIMDIFQYSTAAIKQEPGRGRNESD